MKASRRISHGWHALLAVVTLVLLTACATGPRVHTDTDPQADFSHYRTYGFYQPLAMEQSGYSSYLSDQLKTSIRREMDARGYRFDAASPDLKVNFQGVIRERTDVYQVPRSDVRFFYSYRARSYVGFPVWYDETRISQYTEGTLTVDLVDAAKNRLVWTGDAIGRVTQKTAQQRAVAADQAISAIFAKYPYRAGSGAPSMPATHR
ncbi:DUF4136 domain-containing protein [Lysobacter sp. CW239]|uniref:DUF4136 domain-containing protein n=1 Tax=Lysobacteraceae TaxID=32033 RepID=UPI00068BC528|nr:MULTISPECIES: DUF4136 domain-containing protein [Lysobacter]QOD92130.1 DUF4136 domain-containing protein [Lysobacter sp. CW239]